MERLFSKENQVSSFVWFFPAPTRNERGIVPAPPEAIKKRDELKKDWLNNKEHPQEVRSVSLSPTTVNDQTGYQVRAEIFIRGVERN